MARLTLVTARVTPLPAVAAATLLSAVTAAAVAKPWDHGSVDFGVARIAVVFAALGLGYALDDPTAATVAPSPTSLPRRRALRVMLAGAVTLAGTASVLVGLAAWGSGFGPLEPARLALEAAGLSAIVLAASAWRIHRRGGGSGATAGVAAAFGLYLGSEFVGQIDPAWSLFAGPGGEAWSRTGAAWAALSAWAALAVLWLSRDPASRSH